MTVKELMEILSNQNPDAEVTITKKVWEEDYGNYEYETDNFTYVEMSFSHDEVNFCY